MTVLYVSNNLVTYYVSPPRKDDGEHNGFNADPVDVGVFASVGVTVCIYKLS